MKRWCSFCRVPLAERDVPFDDVGWECQITPRTSANLTYKSDLQVIWFFVYWEFWMCILVTGGTGFIGSHPCVELLS